jgi:hypothetical protein
VLFSVCALVTNSEFQKKTRKKIKNVMDVPPLLGLEKRLRTPTNNGALWIGTLPKGMIDQYKDEMMNLELRHQPEIIVYGKKCHQRRDVQFFSNKSKVVVFYRFFQ